MAEQAMRELENATQIVLAPPDVVTPAQRQTAEKIILDFRKSKMPYSTCKHILENCQCDFVLFQAATTIKEGVVREWLLLSSEQIESLRSFLLRFITQHISLQSYVREQILQTVAVILKRGTIDEKGASRESLFEDVTRLVSSGNVTMQLVACSLLIALLNEYASASRASNVGFTWEFHFKCKRRFEEEDLKRVFLFAIQVLNELEKQPSPLSREATAVMNRLLSIAEQVLSWEFTPKAFFRRYVGCFESTQNVILRPNDTWRDTLLDPELLKLLFRVHSKVRQNSEMAHRSMQCLLQMASLSGPVFPNDAARTHFLATYIENFLHMFGSIDLEYHEYLGVAQAIKNLVLMFPLACFTNLSEQLLNTFISQMTKLTVSLCNKAVHEDLVTKDETIHMEAYERMLEAWMQIISNVRNFPRGFLRSQAVEVFNSYLQCHLTPPDGTRSQMCGGEVNCEEEEEIEELEEDDRDKFSDQLSSIGSLGRLVADHTVPLMARVIEERVNQFNNQLQILQQMRAPSSPQNLNTSNMSVNEGQFKVLYEDLHWLILIAGHLLTEDSEGDTSMIPADIMEYSISQEPTVNQDVTLRVLGSPNERIDNIPGAEQGTDNVVRLVAAVFKVCDVHRQAIDARLADCLSPQVGSTVMWFLQRWAVCYLLPEEACYTQISLALVSAFGRDTSAAQWAVDFLLGRINSNLSVWSGEEALMNDSLRLLVALVDNKPRCNLVVKCKHLWDLVKQEASNQPPLILLSPACKRFLLKGLVLAGTATMEAPQKEEYWKYVLQSLHERFYQTVCRADLGAVCHTAEVKSSVLNLLESMCGVALASRVDIVQQLFNFLYPLLLETVKILDLYHNYEDVVPLVLELFSEVVQRQLCYLTESDSRKIYQLALSLIETYSKHNISRKICGPSDEEEEKYCDIVLMMEMLTHLLSKDFIDFGDREPENPNPAVPQISAAEVVLFGLNTIIPLMNSELLKFPNLCSQYFKLITFLSECHPEKFCLLPPDLFKAFMDSVQHGLNSYGPDITKMCLEIIAALASHVCKKELTGSPLYQAMDLFLKVVFQLLLLDSFDMDLLETASTALFCLVCCHKEKYSELVGELLQQHEPEERGGHKERLLCAFSQLTPDTLKLSVSRHNKIAFLHNFEQFLINVRGILCVK
ncbi:exportin-4-like [Argonauta hians]